MPSNPFERRRDEKQITHRIDIYKYRRTIINKERITTSLSSLCRSSAFIYKAFLFSLSFFSDRRRGVEGLKKKGNFIQVRNESRERLNIWGHQTWAEERKKCQRGAFVFNWLFFFVLLLLRKNILLGPLARHISKLSFLSLIYIVSLFKRGIK